MNTSWKTVRVFISSTFRDMQAERDWLVRFVFPLLREELVKYRIHFVDVDLRWGVTSDQNALGVCREVIDECHPRFLCLLGGRYGWVPDGQDKSITADEIHYGVLGREAEKRGHAFFYFRDERATARMAEERPGDFREPDGSDNARKLTKLKKAIVDAGLNPRVYGEGARWDATQKRLTGLEGFGDKVRTDLFESLKNDPDLAARFTADSSEPLDEFAEEAEQMEAFIEERTDRYVIGSREPLMRELLAFAAADGTPNIFVLTGDPGSGKSALLAKFTRDFSSLHPSPFILPTFVGASTGSTDLRHTLRRLCHELAHAAGNTEPMSLDIKDLIIQFQKLLAEATGRRRVVLVFDALNQFDSTDGAHWLNWLPTKEKLPTGVRVVASVIAPADGQPEHQTLAILRTRPGTRMEKLEPLTEADTLAIIEGSLQRYAKRLSPEQLAALLAKPAGRLPLYILTALEELRTLGTYEEITDRIHTLPGDARALFGWILTERLARDPGFRDRDGRPCGAALVEKFAACLGVSRHGLSQAELTDLLDPGDPLGNVAALLRLLRPYFMRRGELLDFYHGQFREAAEAAHLDTPEKQRAAHQSVATCLQAFADPHRDGQCRDATPHALSELPFHLTRAENWPDLTATLENIFFLEAKVTHGMTFDLAEDFTAAVDALPVDHVERQRLHLLDEAMRRDIHFIARHARDYSQALFQCLWNSAWWYDCPEAARHYRVSESGRSQSTQWGQPKSKLSTLLEMWRGAKEALTPGFHWLRSIRPPPVALGTAMKIVLRGHDGFVFSVAFSPAGDRIVSGSDDNTVRVWDAGSGAEMSVLRGHEWPVHSVGFSSDGNRIVSGSDDKTVRVWDAHSGVELAVLRGHEHRILSVAFSPSGDRIASGSRDGTARVWNATTGAKLAELRGHTTDVTSVAFSPSGNRIITGAWDNTVRVWDAISGAELAVLRGHKSRVTSVAFSPDGDRIVSGSDFDKTVRVWNAQSGVELAVLRTHESGVHSVAFSPKGNLIAGGSGSTSFGGDHLIQVWDAESGAELAVLRGHEIMVNSVAFSPGGDRIVSGSLDKTIRVWDAIGGVQPPVPHGHEAGVTSLAFSPVGNRIASSSADKTVRLWNAESGVEMNVLRGHLDAVQCVAFSPAGDRLVSGGGMHDQAVRVWDASIGTELSVLRGHLSEVTCVAFSPRGDRIASGSLDDTVRVWVAERGAELAVLCAGGESAVYSVAFSPTGDRIASAMGDNTVRLWHASNGVQFAVLQGHKDMVDCVAFSPSGDRIVSASWDRTVRVWDAYTGAELAVLRGHEGVVRCVSYSPDGARIVSRSGVDLYSDHVVRVWDANSGRCLEEIKGLADVEGIAVSLPRGGVRIIALRHEVVVEKQNGDAAGWFPIGLKSIVARPSVRIWAGSTANFVCIVKLEGDIPESNCSA